MAREESRPRQDVRKDRVRGWCNPEFTPVAESFARNFAQREERGASVCLIHKGQVVVDLWGGFADVDASRPWSRETVSVIFSATKAATAICIHLLAERGRIDLDAAVTEYWPGYGAAGKAGTTVRMVLDHTAGIPALYAPLKPDCLTDHAYMAEMIAAAEPVWEPGSRTAYHPLTMGFVLAELVRRVDGRSLGRFFAEEVAGPLGLDFWIGLPEEQEWRVAPVIGYRPPKNAHATRFTNAARTPGTLQNLFFFNHGDWQARGVNTRCGRAAEIGAANGITNAAGLAKLYAAFVPGGSLGWSPERLASFGQATSATHLDGMLLQPTRFGSGFMLNMDNREGARGDSMIVGRRAFGHVGAGGSIGFCDPESELAFGYMMNRLGPGFLLNPRGQALVDAAYASIAAMSARHPLTAPTVRIARTEELSTNSTALRAKENEII